MIKKLLLAGLLLVALVGLPLTVYLFQNRQDLRSRASASTTLYFLPPSSQFSPIEKFLGNTIPLDIMINPGNNAVSILKIHLRYDPTKLQGASATPLAINQAAFPTIIEGPINDTVNGNIYLTISVGTDPTKAIRAVTRVGTLNLKAIAPTTEGSSAVSFGGITQAYSVAAGDQAGENVLSSVSPAYLNIADVPTPTPTLTPTETPTPTDTPTPTPTIIPQATRFSIVALLNGIGNSGDNVNPTASSLSNKNPFHQTRTVTVGVYNASNQLVLTKTGQINYDQTDGDFTGIIPMGMTLTTGDYIVKVKTDSFLQRKVAGIIHIIPQTQINLPTITMIAGDSNADNALNILDYNMLIGCYSDLLPATFCDETKAVQTDLNDDTHVNQTDYNLFLREITVQAGD